MLKEVLLRKFSKTEILERTYVKGGLSPNVDGTKVFNIDMDIGYGDKGLWISVKKTLFQENFKKNALGFLAVLEIGLEKGVAAIQNLEALEKRATLSAFRGAEH